MKDELDLNIASAAYWSHLELGIKGADKIVFDLIYEISRTMRRSCCEFSVRKIAHLVGLSPNTVNKSIQTLKKNELIKTNILDYKRKLAYYPNWDLVKFKKDKLRNTSAPKIVKANKDEYNTPAAKAKMDAEINELLGLQANYQPMTNDEYWAKAWAVL